MQLRTFGTTNRPVAVMGQGSWQIEKNRKVDAIAALRAGLDLGLTHIDTAEMYGDGASERIIAEAISGRRDEVFLVSKVLPSNASTPRTLIACEQSLRNLKTDRLDCYLLHWRGRYPLAETFAAFESLQRDGKILSWGVSNFDVDDLEEISALGGVPACNQVLYHLGDRAIEHAVLPWCESHGVAVVAYTPLGKSAAMYDGASAGSRVLQQIAARLGATPRQVALRFLVRHPGVFAIPKAASIAHVRENAAVADVALTAADFAAIDAAFGRGTPGRGLPTN
ncbi:MAG: aldo/keto reductase [Steroidobacteraceae bacterium]